MKFKISSICTHEIIAPKEISQWINNTKGLFLIVALNPIVLEWRKSRKFVNQGSIVIGGKFRMYNSSEQPIYINGLLLKSNQWKQTFNQPIVLDTSDLQIKKLTTSIEKVFNTNNISNELLHSTEKELNTLYNTLLFYNKETQNSKNLGGKIDSRLITVHRYIRNHYKEHLTLQDLGNLIGCNPVYLSNMYSHVFNISPIKYMHSLLMQEAIQLLTLSSMNISEIAYQLGYVSVSQFSFYFKKHYQVTPTQYRTNQKIKYHKLQH